MQIMKISENNNEYLPDYNYSSNIVWLSMWTDENLLTAYAMDINYREMCDSKSLLMKL